MKGWGPKSSACPSKPRETKLLAGYPAILPGYPRGARKVRTKKVCLQFWAPRSGGVAAIVCDTTGNTVRQRYCYTCLAMGGGGYFGRVTKALNGLRSLHKRGIVHRDIKPANIFLKKQKDEGKEIHNQKPLRCLHKKLSVPTNTKLLPLCCQLGLPTEK